MSGSVPRPAAPRATSEPFAVDLIAPGPPPIDPYDPAAPAWTLARGLRARGVDVRVVYPGGGPGAAAPEGLASERFPALPPHLGYAQGDAELARTAARHVRPHVDLVVRDPLRPGPLGLPHRAGSAMIAGIVRGLEWDAAPAEGLGGGAKGRTGLLGRWRERSSVRRLEAAALREAGVLLCEGDRLAGRLREVYGLAVGPDRLVSRGVDVPPAVPSRTEARLALGVPPDDPVVVAVSPQEDAGHESLQVAGEAFARLRPIFAGAHLLLAGAPSSGGNAVSVLPSRDLTQLVPALAAGDLAVFVGPRPSWDPGVALALCVGTLPIVAREAYLPAEVEPAIRRVEGTPPELASALAELLADPAARRERTQLGRQIAARFTPTSVADELLTAVGRRPG